MRALLPLFLVLAAALGAGGVLLAERQSPDPDPGVRYVDLQRCLDSYQAAQQELVRINEKAAGMRASFEERRAAIEGREEDMRVMDPNSEAFLLEGYQIEADKQRLQADMQFATQRLQNEESALLVRTWLAVQRAAAEVGARENFGAVIVVPKDMDAEMLSQPGAALEALQYRNLLWSNPNYDVSDQVIAVLNRS